MKTSEVLEKEFIAAAKELTGKTIEQWMGTLKPTGLTKMKETTDFLKKEKGIGHMHATFIAGIFGNDGKPVYDSAVLFDAHFEGRPEKKKLYDRVEELVKTTFSEVQIVPTKGYISFRNKREFAVARINNKEIRIGLDLEDTPFDAYVQKAKSLGTMPRISHMVEVTESSEINDDLNQKLKEANQFVNG